MTRCLVIDGDGPVRRRMTETLERFAIVVTTAGDGREARRLAGSQVFDVVVLDTELVDERGFGLCRWLIAVFDLPVLVVTAERDAFGKVLALEHGADDVLAKPCSPRELVARIQAIVRGKAHVEPPSDTGPERYVCFAGWRLDRVLCRLTAPSEAVVALSKAEYRVLEAFVRHPGRILDRNRLVAHDARGEDKSGRRRVDLCISRLRRKLFDADGTSDLIRTVRGEGYFLDARIGR